MIARSATRASRCRRLPRSNSVADLLEALERMRDPRRACLLIRPAGDSRWPACH
ncbi:MAG: hypothetical protein AVDCRST_MAG71-1205 [uncultured Lysobacter sp.]|uniref:Uncharacterized protein n=1 Tax=uncultured Lysobacter sp. TaxID=271060 RepID=A0A6J4L1D0_9GAMM|nr:MAG: hypothetical protein AVDCRST_MAG71-1205 [uncultured Lysobacter sp.]